MLTLPNLSPPDPTPFTSDGYVICSADDRRLNSLAESAANATAHKMLNEFRTARGEAYKPGCFLIRADIPLAERDAEAIRAFRNLCALSTTTAAYALGLHAHHAAQWRVLWSDQFLFGYFVAGKDGSVQTLRGAVRGMDDKTPQMQPSAQFFDPRSWSLTVDEPLLGRLFRCWRLCYLQRKNRRVLSRLFRALEVAFHASLYPADGLTSINDVGTRLALWVSAFEVLCHPGIESVDKRHVQAMLASAPYTLKALAAPRYTISYKKQKIRVTLPEDLYDDLYWARNQFLHGMPVTPPMLRYRQSKRYPPLANIAPVLFNAALVSHLNRIRIPGGPMKFGALKTLAKYMHTREGIDRVQKGIVCAARRQKHSL